MSRPIPDFKNPQALAEYAAHVTADEMERDMATWDADATDLLAMADLLRFFCKKDRHARAAYRFALNNLEVNPSRIAPDTNVVGAYASYGGVLLDLANAENDLSYAEEAVRALTTATMMEQKDAALWYSLAVANVFLDRTGEAVRCAKRALDLEGIDKRQSPEFFEPIREFVAENEAGS